MNSPYWKRLRAALADGPKWRDSLDVITCMCGLEAHADAHTRLCYRCHNAWRIAVAVKKVGAR